MKKKISLLDTPKAIRGNMLEEYDVKLDEAVLSVISEKFSSIILRFVYWVIYETWHLAWIFFKKFTSLKKVALNFHILLDNFLKFQLTSVTSSLTLI